ncbi:MAG: YHS domain-containing protein [Candidatus Omnitrophota bacterium]
MKKDPVCGMDIEKEENCIDHNGEHFCFCSKECRDKFVEAPEKYE